MSLHGRGVDGFPEFPEVSVPCCERQILPIRSPEGTQKVLTMAELRFASGDRDRRRRMLAAEQHADQAVTNDLEAEATGEAVSRDAFQLLSRDQMMRRLISPRLWKHVVVVTLLTLLPLALIVMTLSRAFPSSSGVAVASWNAEATTKMFESIAGLELFIAGQLCLLICWVRSGSPVDYRGHYRAWRWLAGLLCMAAFLVLSHGVGVLSGLMAQLIRPILGSIESAKPALFFVPTGAFAAFTLRYVIADMGRCRPAQCLAIAAIGLTTSRIFGGLRGPLQAQQELLGNLDLLIAGLTLSAAQLHCRYVIHINPHPPVRIALATLKPAQDEVADFSPPPAPVSTTTPASGTDEDHISDLAAIAQTPASKSPKAPRKTSRKAG